MAKNTVKKAAARAPRKPTEVQDKLKAIVERLETEFKKRVELRKPIEDRWLMDARQFHGEYEPELKQDLDDQDKSTLFMNETMPKTLACSARLYDMLFPTDDRNWGIGPTPVPTLTEAAEGLMQARDAEKKANAALKAGDAAAAEEIATEANAQAETADAADETLRAAQKAAKGMQLEIEDQLKECSYAAESRQVIEDMSQYGAGVMEGPVASDRVRQLWKTRPVIDPETNKPVVENGEVLLEDYLENVTDPRPAARRVDFWGFFPESDAMKPEDSSDFFVRHIKSARKMREMARQPGFDKDVIRRLLKDGPSKGDMPQYLSELRLIGKTEKQQSDDRFVVKEYRGYLTADDLIDVCQCLGAKTQDEDRKRKLGAIAKDAEEADPLDELNVVLWFCQGEVLKFGIHHLDRGEPIYSVVPLEKDPASMWGLGIPALMRDPQSALNGAWRMMMDNGGISSGPMYAFNQKKLKPVDGNWDIYARKVFNIADGTQASEKLYELLEIASNQGDYAGIIELARQFIDTMSGQPLIAQGEQPVGITKTLGGMAMLMNSANILIRRIVRNFDDNLTTPMIRRFYDWNMQFNKKRSIKGDQTVEARGSSVLLVKELQSQNIMAFALNFAGHPIFGRYIKPLETIQEVANTNMVPASKVLKTEAEVKAEDEKAAEQPQPKTPEEVKAENALALEDKRHQNRMAELAVEQDIAMMQYAEKMNLEYEKVRVMYADRDAERKSKERLFAAEVAVEQRNAGGGGSGGYVSAPPAKPAEKPAQPRKKAA